MYTKTNIIDTRVPLIPICRHNYGSSSTFANSQGSGEVQYFVNIRLEAQLFDVPGYNKNRHIYKKLDLPLPRFVYIITLKYCIILAGDQTRLDKCE